MSRTMTNNNYENLVSPNLGANANTMMDTLYGNWNLSYEWVKCCKKYKGKI